VKLQYHEMLSSYAYNINLRRYTEVMITVDTLGLTAAAAAAHPPGEEVTHPGSRRCLRLPAVASAAAAVAMAAAGGMAGGEERTVAVRATGLLSTPGVMIAVGTAGLTAAAAVQWEAARPTTAPRGPSILGAAVAAEEAGTAETVRRCRLTLSNPRWMHLELSALHANAIHCFQVMINFNLRRYTAAAAAGSIAATASATPLAHRAAEAEAEAEAAAAAAALVAASVATRGGAAEAGAAGAVAGAPGLAGRPSSLQLR